MSSEREEIFGTTPSSFSDRKKKNRPPGQVQMFPWLIGETLIPAGVGNGGDGGGLRTWGFDGVAEVVL